MRATGAVLLVCALSPSARAQTLVLEVTSDARSPETVAAVASALGGASHGQALRARVIERVSSAPSDPTAALLAELQALVEEGIRDFYHNDFAASVDKLSRAGQALQDAIDRVGQDELVSRHLFESRMILAVALRQSGQMERATEVLRECIRTFPDLHPGRAEFSPDVIRLFEELKARMDASETGQLEVLTDPWGCAVLRDGQFVGVTPLRPLQTYRGGHTIQVRCGDRPLRVRRVVVSVGLQRIRVNARTDAALLTDDRSAWLAEGPGVLGAALEIGRALGADEIVLVRRSGVTVRLERVDVVGGRIAAGSRGSIDDLDALVQGLRAVSGSPAEPEGGGIDALDATLLTVAAIGIVGGTAIAIASVVPGTTECAGGRMDVDDDCEFQERPGNLWPVAGIIATGAVAGAVFLVRTMLEQD